MDRITSHIRNFYGEQVVIMSCTFIDHLITTKTLVLVGLTGFNIYRNTSHIPDFYGERVVIMSCTVGHLITTKTLVLIGLIGFNMKLFFEYIIKC